MKKALIVDDNRINREAIGTVFSLDWPEFQLLEAADGCQAIELAVRERPNLIVLNGTMPILDGHDAAMILRQKSTTKEIPLIGLTAAPFKSDVAVGLRNHCNVLLLQPFPLDAFRAAVKGLI